MIASIVAVDEKWGIGKNNDLLVNIPEDKKYFRNLTRYNIVIMGRKTWDSLPVKPLKDRVNVVITNNPPKEKINGAVFGNIDFAKTIIKCLERAANIYIIGGGQIYKEFLNVSDIVYVTKVEKTYDADTFFPNIDKDDTWELVSESDRKVTDNNIGYRFCTYKKINRKD